jgi:Ser/Thr protein kinase RdoA (MazF antagonist)
MTKRGSFKRKVRNRARQSGEKYTKVRAGMARVDLPTEGDTAVEHDSLRAHLEKRYGLSISSLTPFDGDHPLTFRVEHKGGAPWVARTFASAWRPVERVQGDAEILQFLETHGYPAERLAHHEPVSAFDGHGVLVTEFVEGVRIAGANMHHSLGELLGRLHALPPARGALARDGGAFGHDIVHEGRPVQDLAAAMNFLNIIEDKIASANRAKFDALRETVANAETCEDLPEALTHPNFGEYCTVVRPDGEQVVVAWCAAGRGPRIAALAWLLWLAADAWHASGMGTIKLRFPANVDAAASGYAAHVRLTDEEIERLPGAMMMRSLYMACWYYWVSIGAGYQPFGGEGWWPNSGPAKAIAERAIAAFAEAGR